ncbi:MULTISPECIES: signal peptidase I [unclassified Pseudofrankia]|uniref:signal peptidase I n=1 Tax=unclassified Pseudofrankia TaxID=2994372 RepID=UPI0009F3F997|nr:MULTISPECIES: signal peptidase I [unclassified Pseudofrankia]MDT3443790.1 signal peptidase I [Pseudofrankia sp. BMG5.37]
MSSSEQGTPDPADIGGALPAGAGLGSGRSPAGGSRPARGPAPAADRGAWDDDGLGPAAGDGDAEGDRVADEPDDSAKPTTRLGRRVRDADLPDRLRRSGRNPGRARPGRGDREDGRGSFLRELPVLVLIAFVLALLIKALLVQAFWIPSESMERTLLINDRVLVNKVVYHFRDVHRGDIVVFNGDGTGFQSHESVIAPPSNGFSRFVRGTQNLLGLGAPSDKDFIKRVIGVGGDTVSCCDSDNRVMVNGKALDEPYVFENDFQPFAPVKVPDGRLWVMGDHRGASSDSRANGTIPTSAVVGRAFVRVWPLSRFGFLTVPGTFHGIPAASSARPVTGTATPGTQGDESLPVGTPASVPLVGVLALAIHAGGGRRGLSPGRGPGGGRASCRNGRRWARWRRSR